MQNIDITQDLVDQILNLGEVLSTKQKEKLTTEPLLPLINEYLEHLKDKAKIKKSTGKSSLADYNHNVYTFRIFLRLMPIKHLKEFNLEIVQKFIKIRRGNRIADNTIRTDVGDLIRFNKWLIKKLKKSRLDEFSYKETGAPSKFQCLERCAGYIPRDQVFLFWRIAMKNRAFKEEYDMRLYQAIISMYVFNGTRLNEPRFIFNEKTYPDKGYIQLHPDHNKAGRADKIFLHPNYIPILKKFIACRDSKNIVSPWLFYYSRPDTPISDSTIERWFAAINKTMAKKYGYTQRVTTHLLRHSLGHNSIMDGVPASQVQKILRHSDVATTLRFYTHAGDKEAMEGIRAYNPFFSNKQSPKTLQNFEV